MPYYKEKYFQEIAENAIPTEATEDVPDKFVLEKFKRH